MKGLRAWFDGRSLRERRLILVMLGLLALTLLWGAVIRPVRDGLSATRERYGDALIRLGETEAKVAALKRLQRGGIRPLEGPLADAVRARAADAGFALSSLDPDGDRVRIAIANAKPGALLGWVAGLEADGVLVDGLAITGNGDGTVAAQMTLKGRRG